MKDRSGQRRARLAYGQGVEKVFEFARAAEAMTGMFTASATARVSSKS